MEPETCRRETHRTLPRLLSVFRGADSAEQMIGLFRGVTEVFVPHISLTEMEQVVFSQVLPKVVKEFQDLTSEISRLSSELSNQKTDLKNSVREMLQDLAGWLEALTLCVSRVSAAADDGVTLEDVASLPASVLQILLTAFTHCKDSDALYSGKLHLVVDLLQVIFKDAVCLQKQLMELLDQVAVSGSEKEVACLVSVLHAFLDVCAAVSKMDHALHANTWKFIIKQSIKHQSLVEGGMRHTDVVTSLCDDVLSSFQSCLHIAQHMEVTGVQENTDQRLFQKNLKLGRFFLNSLLHYTKEFRPSLGECCVSLHHLYNQIHSLCPPSLYAAPVSDQHQEEIGSVVLVPLDLLIGQLLSFRPFLDSVLSVSPDLPREQRFPRCRLLIHILDKLPSLPEDVQLAWCSGDTTPQDGQRASIFTSLFRSFASCSPEICAPVTMKENISFSQYVCVHLCAYVVSLPPVCFPELEISLLSAVTSPRMTEASLAMDVWCFLARVGSTELCAHHVAVLAGVVKSCPGRSPQLSHLVVLLRRLLFLLDADHQESFIGMFSPEQEENLNLWRHISLSCLPEDLASRVQKILSRTAMLRCRNLLNDLRSPGELQDLNVALPVLACSSSGRVHQGDAAALLSQMIPLLPPEKVPARPLLQETFSLFLDLFSSVSRTADAETFTQVMSLVSALCQRDAPSHVKLAVLDFLSRLSSVLIPQEAQAAILPMVSGLFSVLLSDPLWLLGQLALETFAQFAEETSYEEIVPQTLNSESVKQSVVSFLNKELSYVEPDPRRTERLEGEGRVLETFFVNAEKPESSELCRKISPRDAEYEIHVQSAEQSFLSVQRLIQESPAPAWLPDKLRNLQTLLNNLQLSCHKP